MTGGRGKVTVETVRVRDDGDAEIITRLNAMGFDKSTKRPWAKSEGMATVHAYERGASIKDIAATVGRTVTAVRAYLTAQGIRRKPKGGGGRGGAMGAGE